MSFNLSLLFNTNGKGNKNYAVADADIAIITDPATGLLDSSRGVKVDGVINVDIDLLDSILESSSVKSVNFVSVDSALKPRGSAKQYSNDPDVGVVLSFKDSVVTIKGMMDVRFNELIHFECGASGLALNLEHDIVKALVFGGSTSVRTSELVKRSGRVMSVTVGDGNLGRVVDAIGRPIDGLGTIKYDDIYPVERKAPGVITRKKISESLETGLTIVDSLVPIGRGQRELILGDRKTGKTTIAIDSIMHQMDSKRKLKEAPVCVYVAIGKRMSEISRLVENLKLRGMMYFTTVVAARSSDPASMQYVAPYSACAMAEYFTYKGRHALIIYDDLSRHADAYRQLSLLLRRPVGREAYPGDIFYLHSRLLERAVKLSKAFGLGSLTALPVVETVQGDVSAYIPTNVISITDGQIYLDLNRHQEGLRPAVDPGISVSRVGSSAQSKMMKKLAGSLKLELAQFREVEQFSKFGSELDAATLKQLEKGKFMVNLLKQDRNTPKILLEQLTSFYLSSSDFFDEAVLKHPSINPFAYLKDAFFFMSTASLVSPFRVVFGKHEIAPSILDFVLKVHYEFFFSSGRNSWTSKDVESAFYLSRHETGVVSTFVSKK